MLFYKSIYYLLVVPYAKHTEPMYRQREIETVMEETYLGQLQTWTDRTEKEVNVRITKTLKKYWSLKHISNGPFNPRHKSRIFNMCVVLTMTYGCQTLALTSKII